jgi:SAM-dependent methyltransferase
MHHVRAPDIQLEYWNTVGPTKSFAHPVNLKQLSRWIGPTSRILDYGCGYGRALGILQSKGYANLVGVDPAPAMIAAARAAFPAISFEVLDHFRSTGLENSSVDAALLFAVLTSVPSDEGQRAIVSELRRVLRPGGLLHISDMWLQTSRRDLERYALGEEKYGTYGIFDLPEGVTVRHHTPDWIEELTQEYRLLALDEIQVQTMNGHAARAFQWFGRKGIRSDSG